MPRPDIAPASPNRKRPPHDLICAGVHLTLAATAALNHDPIVALAETAIALAELDRWWRGH